MGDLTQQEKVANALIQAKGLHYGSRYDNPAQLKGSGFYGPLPTTDGSGRISTEISGDSDGFSYPLIYSGISKSNLDLLLSGQATPEIYKLAEEAARGRTQLGLPAFALEGEQSQFGQVAPSYGIFPTKPTGVK